MCSVLIAAANGLPARGMMGESPTIKLIKEIYANPLSDEDLKKLKDHSLCSDYHKAVRSWAECHKKGWETC